MDEDSDEESVTCILENILNQSIGNTGKHWHELVNISEKYSEVYDEGELMDKLDELLEEKIIDKIRSSVLGMSVNQKQAALTALQNFYYSLYKNPDLAFALINIPVYGVKEMDQEEHDAALNDLLAVSAKYNDLAVKNHSMETIQAWNEYDKYYENLNKKIIQTALANFKNILLEISYAGKTENPDLHELANKFNIYVTFMIERGQPNAIKRYLKSFHINSGKGFIRHIDECLTWFQGFDSKYEIEDLYAVITKELLDSAYAYLNTVGEIRTVLK